MMDNLTEDDNKSYVSWIGIVVENSKIRTPNLMNQIEQIELEHLKRKVSDINGDRKNK